MPPNNTPNQAPNPYYPPNPHAQISPLNTPPAGGPALSGGTGGGLPPVKAGRPLGLIISIVVLSLLLLSALGFGFWAYAQRQDYKNNFDQKAAVVRAATEKSTTEANNKRFAEELKNPLKTYTGPADYGSIKVVYPKTWSAYIDTSADSNDAAVAGYFHPDYVPSTRLSGTNQPPIALKVKVVNQTYKDVMDTRRGLVEGGQVTAEPFSLPKAPKITGTKFVGKLSEQLNGTEIVLPLRDKTLTIATDTDQFLADFNTYILPNMTFEP